MRVTLDQGAKAPTRAFPTDAGLDLYALNGVTIQSHQSATIRTGVHIELPRYTMGDIRPKSGLMFSRDLLTFGTVDEGYSGEIMVHIFNLSDDEYHVRQGDKVAQLAIVPVAYCSVEVVDSISAGDRGNNGFGSTGV